jgi:hypothetical protein
LVAVGVFEETGVAADVFVATGVRVLVNTGVTVGVLVDASFETTIFTKTTPPNPLPWSSASLQ